MQIIIPNHAAPDSFVDNVSFTLRQMGHEVLTMPVRSNRWLNSPVVRMGKEIWEKLNPHKPNPNEEWLLRNIPPFKPDIVLCLTQSLGEETLAETRRLGVANRVAWWGDTVGNMKGMGLLTKEWDHIYIKDPHGVVKLRRLGLNVTQLHEAMNPFWHKPLASCSNEEVVIAGTFYGYRQVLTSALISNGLEVGLYGGRLPRWVKPEIRARHSNRFVIREEKSRTFGMGLACLNSTTLTEGNSMNCRAFEIAGAGGFQVLENRAIVSECFEPGKELAVFNSIPEMLELILRAKAEPPWAAKIRMEGSRRALAHHTYQQRLETILANLS